MEVFLILCDWGAYLTGAISMLLIILEWFTPYADKIEYWIDEVESASREISLKYMRTDFYTACLTVAIPVTLLMVSIPIVNASPVVHEFHMPDYTWTILILVAVPSYLGFSIYFVSSFINRCNSLTGGHAIGGIGVILGIIGFVFDSVDKLISSL